MSQSKNVRTRLGMTLLELVVVMAILAALAAILLPMLPDMVGKGNQISGATNIVELEKLIQAHKTMNFRFPDGYDSLLTSSGTVSDLLASPGDTPLSGAAVAGALDAGQVARLNRAGITKLYDILAYADTDPADDVCDFNATNDCYDGVTRTLADTTEVVFLVPMAKQGVTGYVNTIAGALGQLLDDTTADTNRFMLVGLGSQCSMVGVEGELLKEAPTAYHHKAISSPSEMYSRFGVIFDCGPQGGTGGGADARFVGVVIMKGKKLFTADGTTEMFQGGAMEFK